MTSKHKLMRRRAAIGHAAAAATVIATRSSVLAADPGIADARVGHRHRLAWTELAELRAIRIANTTCVTATAAEIGDRAKRVVVEHLGVDMWKVTPDASFIDDLGADSLDLVELVMAFEEAFGVEITEETAEKMVNVGDVISYIEKTRCR